MPFNLDYVWERIHNTTLELDEDLDNECMLVLCERIAKARNADDLSRNQIANLMRGIRRDLNDDNDAWEVLCEESYERFLRAVGEYQLIRGEFMSRDREPDDPEAKCWSNEKLYGRGINSNVRRDDVVVNEEGYCYYPYAV
jgi:hypothetical protein